MRWVWRVVLLVVALLALLTIPSPSGGSTAGLTLDDAGGASAQQDEDAVRAALASIGPG